MYYIPSKQLTEDSEWTKPFGFIAHPKTGTQSMRKALRSLGAIAPGGHHGLDDDTLDDVLDNDGILACTVRNPWDLMVSWYGYNSMKPYNPNFPKMPPFDVWLPRTLEAGNGWIEKGLFYGAEGCGRIIKFEHNMETQLNNILIDCGLPTIKLDHIAASPRTAYQDYYTPKLAIMVERQFYSEISMWGYDFEDKPNDS